MIDWIESSALDGETEKSDSESHNSAWELLRSADGILVPGGFGIRGIEGKIKAAEYARENKIPYLGVCLGLRSLQSNSAAMCSGWREPTLLSSMRNQPMQLLYSCPRFPRPIWGDYEIGDEAYPVPCG